jgi:hypothetical protein
MRIRYQSTLINLMHNQTYHKDSDLKEKTRNIDGMHWGLPFSGKMLVFTTLDACVPSNTSGTCSSWTFDSGSACTWSSLCIWAIIGVIPEVQCISMRYKSDICIRYLWYKLFRYFTFKFILIIYWVKHLKFNNMRFIRLLSISYFMQVHDI